MEPQEQLDRSNLPPPPSAGSTLERERHEDGSVEGENMSETQPMIRKYGPWMSPTPSGRHTDPRLVGLKEYHRMSVESPTPPRKCSGRMCLVGTFTTAALVLAAIVVATTTMEPSRRHADEAEAITNTMDAHYRRLGRFNHTRFAVWVSEDATTKHRKQALSLMEEESSGDEELTQYLPMSASSGLRVTYILLKYDGTNKLPVIHVIGDQIYSWVKGSALQINYLQDGRRKEIANNTVSVLGDPAEGLLCSEMFDTGSVAPSVHPSGFHGYAVLSVTSYQDLLIEPPNNNAPVTNKPANGTTTNGTTTL